MQWLRSLPHLTVPILLAAALTLVALPAVAQVQVASTDLRLASDGTGAGSLAVRVKYPSAVADYR